MSKTSGFILATGSLLIWVLGLWPLQSVTVRLPKKNDQLIAVIHVSPRDDIRLSYRHSVELTRVEGLFRVDAQSRLLAVETRMESTGTGLPNTSPGRTTFENGWLVVDEQQKPLDSLRFFVVPINQTQLFIAGHSVDIDVLEGGTLIEVAPQRIRMFQWVLWSAADVPFKR